MNSISTTCYPELVTTFSVRHGVIKAIQPIPNYLHPHKWQVTAFQGPFCCWVAKAPTQYPNTQGPTCREAVYLFQHEEFAHGLVLNVRDDQIPLWSFRHYFAYIMLRQPYPRHPRVSIDNSEKLKIANSIVDIFEERLLFMSTGTDG